MPSTILYNYFWFFARKKSWTSSKILFNYVCKSHFSMQGEKSRRGRGDQGTEKKEETGEWKEKRWQRRGEIEEQSDKRKERSGEEKHDRGVVLQRQRRGEEIKERRQKKRRTKRGFTSDPSPGFASCRSYLLHSCTNFAQHKGYERERERESEREPVCSQLGAALWV